MAATCYDGVLAPSTTAAMSLSSVTKLRSSASSPRISASCGRGFEGATERKANILRFEETKERIRKLFAKVEISVSAYDTAWVAMVPSSSSGNAPCFPQCVNWLLDNQRGDGSWGLHHQHPLLLKDSLSSTLACILALKKWGIGERQISNGLRFIELNFTSIADEKQHTPVGFDIIFPGLIEYARDLNLNLPLKSTDVDAMMRARNLELSSDCGSNSKAREAYLAFVSEGMGKLQDWEALMKFQRKNGSLFNSPATTAAALSQLDNAGCLHYLQSILQKFENAVPTVYPFDTYARLCTVDILESLGIDRYFKEEIREVLDETYRCWGQGQEEIYLDLTTCPLAFRLLRAHGYDVSPDPLSQFAEELCFFNSLEGYLKDIGGVLQLFKAAQMSIHPDKSALENQSSWMRRVLKMECLNPSIPANEFNKDFRQQVDDALQVPFYASLERLAHRSRIEHCCVDNTRILKTSFCSPNVSNADFLKLAIHDFNFCQSIQREELELLDRWVAEKRLQKLKFARQKLAYCYFSAAATLFCPELSDTRMSWAKNAVLTTIIDDFFDVGGSKEELENLVTLVEKWDPNGDAECLSEQVDIIFSALQSTILEIGEKASGYQGRNVTDHIIEIWLDLLKSMLKEAEWSRNKSVPTVEEYMENGYVSFALGPIVLPAVYFVGPRLSKEIVKSPEFNKLYKLMSTIGRLQNDIMGFKRESEEGKLNAVSLHMIHGSGGGSKEEAIESMKHSVGVMRRELFRLILQEKGSIVPRACKDLFWKMSKVLHLFYMKDDGFTSHDLLNAVKTVIHEPISVRESQLDLIQM